MTVCRFEKKNLAAPLHDISVQVLKYEDDKDYSLVGKDLWQRPMAFRDTKFSAFGDHHPHIERKKAILKRYPLVRLLYGSDPMTKWIISLSVANLILMAGLFGRSTGAGSFLLLLICAYGFGSTIQGLLDVCSHECCHALVAETVLANRLWNLFLNIGSGVPSAMSFARYHPLHHVFQGDIKKDPDMPMDWEVHLVRGSALAKSFLLAILPVMYTARALYRYGGKATKWEVCNFVFILISDIFIYSFLGPRALYFLLISFIFGHSFHPAAGHFIQEHFTWADGQETYNYYGWFNTFYLNIGFHTEHHDFPVIAGRRIILLTAIAHDMYRDLPSFRSWRQVLWQFVMDPTMGPVSRNARSSIKAI